MWTYDEERQDDLTDLVVILALKPQQQTDRQTDSSLDSEHGTNRSKEEGTNEEERGAKQKAKGRELSSFYVVFR